MSNHTPPPWKVYDDSDPLHIAIKGFRSDIGGAHVADVLSPDNAAFLLKAVNNHDALVRALEAIEWRGHQGKCPLCAGWDMSPSGETPGKHTKDCLIGLALAAVSSPGEPK